MNGSCSIPVLNLMPDMRIRDGKVACKRCSCFGTYKREMLNKWLASANLYLSKSHSDKDSRIAGKKPFVPSTKGLSLRGIDIRPCSVAQHGQRISLWVIPSVFRHRADSMLEDKELRNCRFHLDGTKDLKITCVAYETSASDWYRVLWDLQQRKVDRNYVTTTPLQFDIGGILHKVSVTSDIPPV